MTDLGWLDRDAYPFRSRFFDTPEGRLHYVDEGEGSPVVFVHGSAAWSFVYRDPIRRLRSSHRCIAVDHLGFGLSDKPEDADLRPQGHASRFRAFLDGLELSDITLVVHDFGGPIGLSVALERPERVRSLVVCNTWMWSLGREPLIQVAARVGGGPLGRLLVRRLDLETRLLIPSVWGSHRRLDRALHRQFRGPYPLPPDRHAMWKLAGALIECGGWYDELWSQRSKLRDHPTLLIWGAKDRILRPRHLRRWQALFSTVETLTFERAGHFVQVEAGPESAEGIAAFLEGSGRTAATVDVPAMSGAS